MTTRRKTREQPARKRSPQRDGSLELAVLKRNLSRLRGHPDRSPREAEV